MDFALQPRHHLRKFAREPGEYRPVNRNSAPFHPRQSRDHRPLQRFIDGAHSVRDKARLERTPKAQADVGVLRSIFRRLVQRHAFEADEVATGPRYLSKSDVSVSKMLEGEFVQPVVVAAGVERIGNQHRVLDGRDGHAISRQDLQVIFHVVRDLKHGRVFQQRSQAVHSLAQRDLPRDKVGAAEEVACAGRAMP